MIPYRNFGPLVGEDLELARSEVRSHVHKDKIPKVMDPRFQMTFVEDLPWNPDVNAPMELLSNPWLSVRLKFGSKEYGI